MNAEARFWERVEQNGPVPEFRPDLGPCWLWTALKIASGYGQFWFDGRMQVAHRIAYKALVGPIPKGLYLDHLCRVRNCVNPKHLDVVTHRVNILRGIGVTAKNATKTHCPQGHPYEGENLYIDPTGGYRECRICRREASRRWRAKKRAANV